MLKQWEQSAWIMRDGIYEDGKEATVTATAKEGHHFVGWKLKDAEDILSTDAKYTFKVEKDVDLIGVFEKDAEPVKQYTVTATASAETMGTVSMDHEDGIYEDGKEATVTATAKEGHHFVGWKLKDAEDILSTDAKYTFKVEKDVDLIGVFEKDAEPVKQYTVTATASAETMGTVSMDHEDGIYEDGKEATVTATAKEGHHFVGWKLKDAEDILSTDAKYTFKVERM